MKAYTKPTIEFIELRPEERLACTTGNNGSGCCGTGGGGGGGYFWPLACWKPSPIWFFCNIFNPPKKKHGWW